jgi:hypothetical protein
VTSRDLTPFGSVAVCLERQSLFAAVVGRHTAGVAFAERTVSGGRLSGRGKGVIKQTGVATRGAFIQTMYKKGRRYLVAPEPFGDGVRDLEECSGRGSEESAARTYCCSGRTWTLLALRSFRSDLDLFLLRSEGKEGERDRDGRGSLAMGGNGPGRRGKRESRGSLPMGGNGPGKSGKSGKAGVPSQREGTGQESGESGKAGVPSQWEGTGQEKAGRPGFPRNGRERARKAEKAGKPGFPRNGRERARKAEKAGCWLGRKRSRSRCWS